MQKLTDQMHLRLFREWIITEYLTIQRTRAVAMYQYVTARTMAELYAMLGRHDAATTLVQQAAEITDLTAAMTRLEPLYCLSEAGAMFNLADPLTASYWERYSADLVPPGMSAADTGTDEAAGADAADAVVEQRVVNHPQAMIV